MRSSSSPAGSPGYSSPCLPHPLIRALDDVEFQCLCLNIGFKMVQDQQARKRESRGRKMPLGNPTREG